MECMTNEMAGWLAETAGDASTNEIARNAGVTVSTLHRQRTSGNYSPDTVARIARAYGVSVIDALVTLGLIHPDDIATGQVIDGLREATDQQLVAEIARRLEVIAEGDGSVFDEPGAAPDNVHHLRPRNVSAAEEDMDMREVASRDFEINPDQDDHDWDA